MADCNLRKGVKKVVNKAGKAGESVEIVQTAEEAIPSAHTATTAGLDDHANAVPEGENVDLGGSTAAQYLKAASLNFERMMKEAVGSMMESIQRVERALEFEGLRINDLEKKNKALETRLSKMEAAFGEMEHRVQLHDMEANTNDRTARRNNFRVVGIPELADDKEDCGKVVSDILRSKFKMNIQVERAHRDGRRGDRPRHILVKTLSYQEKVAIMKEAREALREQKYYIVDDMTRKDLESKKKHAKKVQDLYQKGTKLRFYAGQWRGDGGAPYFTA